MEKKQYEHLKKLTAKVDRGTATFKERNLYNVIQRRKAKGQKLYCSLKTPAEKELNDKSK